MSTTIPGESHGGDGGTGANETANRLLQMLMQAAERGDTRGARIGEASSTFEEALLKRLETLTAQLAPLRELSPQLAPLPDKVAAMLADIRRSLERPDWSNATRLEPGDLPRRTVFDAPASGIHHSS